MRTILFDIDGTLMLTSNSGGGALKRAIEQEFGLNHSKIDIDFSGRTDRSILIELLEKNAIEPTRENQDRLQRRYVAHLPQLLDESGGWLLPGVLPLLQRIAQLPQLFNCVMTGNLERTARAKLNHFGLANYFHEVFGGDHDCHRNDLARRAAEKLAAKFGRKTLGDLIVIGDTVADIECGHAIGAKVIAVASGTQNRARLQSAGPMAVQDDLSDTEAILDLLVG